MKNSIIATLLVGLTIASCSYFFVNAVESQPKENAVQIGGVFAFMDKDGRYIHYFSYTDPMEKLISRITAEMEKRG